MQATTYNRPFWGVFCYALDNLEVKKILGPLENNNKCLIIHGLPANIKIMSKTFRISSKSGLAIKKNHQKNHTKNPQENHLKPHFQRGLFKYEHFYKKSPSNFWKISILYLRILTLASIQFLNTSQQNKKFLLEWTVLRILIQVGIRCLFDPWIRDPGINLFRIPDPKLIFLRAKWQLFG